MTQATLESTPADFERLEQCPLCGAAPDSFSLVTRRGDRFEADRAVLCGRCGLVFLTPRLTPAALARYYASDRFSREVRGAERPTEHALAYRDMRAGRRWALLRERLPPSGSFLEIGCGAGNFLKLVQQAGYEAIGIDPSSGYAAHGGSLGLNIVTGQFPADLPERRGPDSRTYDIIVLFHVLEHVSDPLALLCDVRARLSPGGVFALEYPDVELAARRRFLPPSYFERQHLFDFSRETIGAFLGMAGFDVTGTILDGPSPPYDRNVLLLCAPAATPGDLRPGQPEPPLARPAEAAALAAALRARLRVSEPLMPLRPFWRFLKRLTARRSEIR